VAVMLRLTRMGRKKRPFYRIVALDKRTRRDGRYLDKVGHYDPLTDPITLVVDHDLAIKWLQVGAQMSDTVKRLFTRDGVLLRWDLVKSETAQVEIEAQVSAHQAKNNKGPSEKSKYVPKDPEPIEPPAPKVDKKAEAKAEEAAPEAKAEEAPAEVAAAEAPAKEEKAEKAAPEAKAEEAPAKEAKAEKAAPEAKAEEAPAKEAKAKKAAPKAKAEEAPAKEAKAEKAAPKAKAEKAPAKEAKAEKAAPKAKAEKAPAKEAAAEKTSDDKKSDEEEKKSE
jgi:small subunit ribosomal protein S16